MTDQAAGMHRSTLRVAALAALAAAVAPAVAAVTGIAAGGLAVYAGSQWASRKLGIRTRGHRWRAPRARPLTPRSPPNAAPYPRPGPVPEARARDAVAG